MKEGNVLELNDDGGSFERIMREVEEAANGDESFKISLLKRINVLVEEQLAKKRCFDLNKKSGEEEEEEVMRKPKKQKGNKNGKRVEEERVVADMPDAFKTRIKEENGTNLVLVVQKPLTKSDLDKNKNRLAIPPTKVRDDQFLNQREKSILEASSEVGIEVLMIPPSLKRNVPLKLKRWKMDNNYTYNLIENWHKLVVSDKDNGLEKDATVQLWSFRKNSSDLCFALVKC